MVSQQIEYIDYETVTDCGSDVWQRPLAIDAHDRSCEHAIRIGSDPGDIEIISDGGSMSIQAQAEKDDTSKGKHVDLDENLQQSRQMWVTHKTSCTVSDPKDTFRGQRKSQYGTTLMDVLLSRDLIRWLT